MSPVPAPEPIGLPPVGGGLFNVQPPLRLMQRSDGLGLNGHARLLLGAGNTSAVPGCSTRVGSANLLL